MRLRTAKKIWNAIGSPREHRYTTDQKARAIDRMERTRISRHNTEFFIALCDALGPLGRARLQRDKGVALDILMRSDEKDWQGDERAWDRIRKLESETPARPSPAVGGNHDHLIRRQRHPWRLQ
jgi:hypothetical protein